MAEYTICHCKVTYFPVNNVLKAYKTLGVTLVTLPDEVDFFILFSV